MLVIVRRLVVLVVSLFVQSYVIRATIIWLIFFFQAEDGIRDLVRSRGLGDVYKRQALHAFAIDNLINERYFITNFYNYSIIFFIFLNLVCLLYTSDAADERSSVDLGGRRIIKKKNQDKRGV